MARNGHTGAFIFGVVLGAAAGAAVTLWLTPRSGPVVRAELTRRARELQDRVMGASMTARERSRDLADQGRQRLGLAEEVAPPVTTPPAARADAPPAAPMAEPGVAAMTEPIAVATPEPVAGLTDPAAPTADAEKDTAPFPTVTTQPEPNGASAPIAPGQASREEPRAG